MGNAVRRSTATWQKKAFAPFHRAELNELRASSLRGQTSAFERVLWTPNIQKIQPDLCFLEYLEELKYTNRANIYNKNVKADDVKTLVSAFLKEAFTEAELGTLVLEVNRQFEPTHASEFHGRVDFFLHQPAEDKYLAMFIHEKRETPDYHDCYFQLGTYAPDVFFDYMLKNFKISNNLMVITTNGHHWKLFGIDSEFRVKPTKVLFSKQTGLLYDDPAVVQAVLGMLRYPLIRYENELLLDQTLEYFNELDLLSPKDLNKLNNKNHS